MSRERAEDCLPGETGDVVAARFGLVRLFGAEEFYLSIDREFSLGGGVAEWDPAVQVVCTFWFEARDELRAIGALRGACPAPASFFERALSLPGFAKGRDTQPRPIRLEISQFGV